MEGGQVHGKVEHAAPVFGIPVLKPGFKDQTSSGNPGLCAVQSFAFKVTKRRRITFHQVLRGSKYKPCRTVTEGTRDLVARIYIRFLPGVNDVKIPTVHQLAQLSIMIAKEVNVFRPFRIE